MKLLVLSCFCVDFFPQLDQFLVGGNALNVGFSSMRQQDLKVSLMGAVGSDRFGEKIKSFAKAHGMDTSYLHQVVGATANNKIFLDTKGDRYFKEDSWQGGVWQDYRLSQEDRRHLHEADLVATTIHDSIVYEVIAEKKKGRFMLAIDFHDDPYQESWEAIIPYIDIFFMSGREDMLPRLAAWSRQYNGLFVATLGAAGSVVYNKGECYKMAAEATEKVIDTTGCGDSYLGAFIADYYVSHDVLCAMTAGTKAAAQTLKHVGGVW